jgi:hypothetical protein
LSAISIALSSGALQGGVAGHRVEAPGLLAGLGVVGGDVAAHAELGAAIADQHLALDDARRPGDGVALLAVEDGVHAPGDLAGLGIERDQTAIEAADVDLALPHRDAAVDGVAAALTEVLAGNLGVEGPQSLAGARIERVDDAPGAGGVHHAVDDDGRGLVAGVDPRQRRMPLLVVGAAVAHPVAGLLVGRTDACAVDIGRRLRCRRSGGAQRRQGQRQDRSRLRHHRLLVVVLQMLMPPSTTSVVPVV